MLDVVARCALSPYLAWQAYNVRKSALKLPDASGERSGKRGTGPDLRLLIVGDSSAAGVGASHQEEALLGHMLRRLTQTNTVTWAVNAKTGSTTPETMDRVRDMPSEKYDLISVSLGVNDITSLTPVHIWIRRYAELLALLEDKFAPDVLCINGIPKMQYFPLLPQPLRWIVGAQAARYDRALRKMVQHRSNCRYVELDFEPEPSLMSPDGYHPGPKIYAEWGRKVYRSIRNDVRQITIN